MNDEIEEKLTPEMLMQMSDAEFDVMLKFMRQEARQEAEDPFNWLDTCSPAYKKVALEAIALLDGLTFRPRAEARRVLADFLVAYEREKAS